MHFVSIASDRSHPCWSSRLLLRPLKRTLTCVSILVANKLLLPTILACWIGSAPSPVQRKARTALKPLTPLKHLRLVHNTTLSNQLLNYCKQLDGSLNTEIAKIQLEQTALEDEIKHLGKGSPESSRCNTQATMPAITLPSDNNA